MTFIVDSCRVAGADPKRSASARCFQLRLGLIYQGPRRVERSRRRLVVSRFERD